MLEEHADYQLIKTQEDLKSALDVKEIKSEYLPTLSAFYNLSGKRHAKRF